MYSVKKIQRDRKKKIRITTIYKLLTFFRYRAFHFISYSASDRNYWDGWASKSMFLRKDGQFTRKDINILENEEICVLVLVSKRKQI